jgi:saccharopine dehydrogenase (NAD+, L-lysine-forming)
MKIKKIGVIREGKVPPDFRVPLSPKQCVEVMKWFGVEVVVQPSPIRRFRDEEYAATVLCSKRIFPIVISSSV